eukprot:GHRR01005603.1.p1 GENE.GHRR01005603.1~~GHRR01005603.1.p1  ORF type:complete len:104 (+),score=3.61 GHRR01005603.1:1324-1635(+)
MPMVDILYTYILACIFAHVRLCYWPQFCRALFKHLSTRTSTASNIIVLHESHFVAVYALFMQSVCCKGTYISAVWQLLHSGHCNAALLTCMAWTYSACAYTMV